MGPRLRPAGGREGGRKSSCPQHQAQARGGSQGVRRLSVLTSLGKVSSTPTLERRPKQLPEAQQGNGRSRLCTPASTRQLKGLWLGYQTSKNFLPTLSPHPTTATSPHTQRAGRGRTSGGPALPTATAEVSPS